MLNNFIYAKSKAMFEERLAEVPNEAIVFIEDTKEIWNHGHYFAGESIDPELLEQIQTSVQELKASIDDNPFEKGDAEHSAVLKGGNNQTISECEVALGKYNVSNYDTQFSIGIGTSEDDRKNAFEVKQNGDIYIEGVEGRIQDKLDKLVEITYSELKSLRDDSKLIPGQQYRITDYVTTTTQENTRSTGHQFDIIVTADDEKTLNEVARACLHKEDTYFSEAGAKLEAWQIWYSLDNDEERFAWAIDFAFLRQGQVFTWNGNDNDSSGSLMYEWEASDGTIVYTKTLTPQVGESTYDDLGDEDGIVDNIINGKGVIYRMIDEWGNDCPYDFKNIQFKRNLNFENGYASFSEDGEERWVYTFAGQSYHINNDEYSDMLDGSLESPFGHMSDEGTSTFHDNTIKPYTMVYNGNDILTECGLRYLNDIVFLGYWEKIGSANDEDMPYYYAYCCYCNSFENDCHSNSFGNNCHSNSFGNNCHSNSFGNNCYFNSFGNNCDSNSFGNYYHNNSFGGFCSNNSFGEGCHSNTFGNNCHSNTFGNNCHSNTFDNNCGSNTFGMYCSNNSFGAACDGNSFGAYCSYNSFVNYFYDNSFIDECRYNSFGNNCYQNSFSTGCDNNSFGNYCHNNSLGYDCSDNSFGNGCYENVLEQECYNNDFGNDCCNNSLVYDCYDNSFGSECEHNNFGNTCNYNSFGNKCRNNSFGNKCKHNSFGNSCQRNIFGDSCMSNRFDDSCESNSFGNNCFGNSFGNNCFFNSFGNYCDSNNFGNACDSNSFGNYCANNSFGNGCSCNSFRSSASQTLSLKNYCYYNHFDDGCSYNVIWTSNTTSSSVLLQNININRGTSGKLSNPNFINIDTLNADYEIQVAKNSKGEIKIYCEADLIA